MSSGISLKISEIAGIGRGFMVSLFMYIVLIKFRKQALRSYDTFSFVIIFKTDSNS